MILSENIPVQLREVIGDATEIRYPRQGCTSEVAVVENHQGMFVLKKTVDKRYREWHAKEAVVLKSLEQTALLVPKLFGFIETKEESWSLAEGIEGETLRHFLENEKSVEKRREAIFAFGEILSKIHATPCPEELKGEEDWLDHQLKDAEYWLEHGEVDGDAELLEKLKADKPVPIGQTLIHGDFTVDNLLYKDGRITGIIDWGGGAFGDPRYDLSLAVRPKAGAFETERDFNDFFKGYGKKIITREDCAYFEGGLYEFF